MTQNSHLIWIPSIQKYLRFREITNFQYRTILKNLNDDTNLDFLYNINQIIKDNLIDNFDYGHFTVFDRFVILIFFKILGLTPFLKLSRVCDKCENSETTSVDLNQLLNALGVYIDKSFKQKISSEDYPIQLICDVPTIKQEYDHLLFLANKNVSTGTTDNNIDQHLYGYIRGLESNGVLINTDAKTPFERTIIFNKLPAFLILKMQKEYVSLVEESLNHILFLDLKCKKCKEPFEIKMEKNNVTFLLKLLFKDNSLENHLGEYYNISSVIHSGGEFLDRLSPKESHILFEYAKASQKGQSETNNSNNNDLFTPDSFSK
jgi:hypothetical protein